MGVWTRYHSDVKEVEIITGDNGPSVPQELMEVMFVGMGRRLYSLGPVQIQYDTLIFLSKAMSK
jgi:hypothetical protein